MEKHIFLIGFMGTGKTTVSAALKKLMQVEEIDMDAAIVQANNMSIKDMFEQFGEQYFRDKETEMVEHITTLPASIVSCGGGAVLREQNVRLMKSCGDIVLLTATPQTVYERVKDGTDRPILNGHMNVEYIAELMEKRRAAYEGACSVSVSTDGKTPEAIAEEILRMCKH